MILSHLLTLYSDIKKGEMAFLSLLWWWWHIYVYIILCYQKKHIAIWWKEVKYKTLDVVRGEDLFLLPLRKSSHGMCMFVYMRWEEEVEEQNFKFPLSIVYTTRELEFIFYRFMCKMLNWNEKFSSYSSSPLISVYV